MTAKPLWGGREKADLTEDELKEFTRFGHRKLPLMTEEQKEHALDLMHGEETPSSITKLHGYPYGQLRVLYNARKTQQAIVERRATDILPKRLEYMGAILETLAATLQESNRRMTNMESLQKRTIKAVARTRSENTNLRTDGKKMKEQLRELRAWIHRLTGEKP